MVFVIVSGIVILCARHPPRGLSRRTVGTRLKQHAKVMPNVCANLTDMVKMTCQCRHDMIVMVSGGSGITPLISVIRELLFEANS
ncbi:unnamed protein product [Malus baccata var. baccata]